LECVIYSGDLIKEALNDHDDPFWGARRLWLAQYGTTPKVQKSWETYWLWQYTDGDVGPEPHHVKGIKEGIDCNSFQRDAAYLKAEWNGGNVIEPPTPVLPEVILTISATPGVKVTIKGP
jgi:GH25 family lysozyme M1 (1,4-beta-N-acetylmuramidase)